MLQPKLTHLIISITALIFAFLLLRGYKNRDLNHNLSNDWQFISGKNKIYAYSLLNTEYSGEIQIELSDPKNIQSIFVNSYK